MTLAEQQTLEASIEIAASPGAVWTVVSDVARMREWSPECFRMLVPGGVRRGAMVVGLNRRGLLVWPTTSRLDRFEAGRAIAWTVQVNGARWTYELEPTPTGTRLHERREISRGQVSAPVRWFTEHALGE